jgi:hypothetical protein
MKRSNIFAWAEPKQQPKKPNRADVLRRLVEAINTAANEASNSLGTSDVAHVLDQQAAFWRSRWSAAAPIL